MIRSRRPRPETLESLRATLQKLEQTDALSDDSTSLSELKRVLLNRIAELELTQVLEKTADLAIDPANDPVNLVPPQPIAEENHPVALMEDAKINK